MGILDESSTVEPFQASEFESLKVLHGFISRLLQRGENDQHIGLIPKDAIAFLQKLEGSDAVSTVPNLQLLSLAHDAAITLAQSFKAGILYLNGQHTELSGTNLQLKKTIGVDALPDEIIASMAERLYGDFGQTAIIRFSHVCQRWRNIALNLPQLWCRPSTFFDRKLNQTLLVRSGAAPLHIRHDRDAEMTFIDHFDEFIGDIGPHFGRCQSVSLLLGDDEDVEGILQFTRILGIKCGGLQAPILETLDIGCLPCDREDNRAISLDDRFHFYASWDMPQLRSLHVTNFIPRPVFGDSLKSLTAKLSAEEWHGSMDMQLLLNFLASAPQLEDLSIILRNSSFCFRDSDSDSENSFRESCITLENVKSLTLDYDNEESEAFGGGLYEVLNSIVTPNVTELSLRAHVKTWSEIGDWLEVMFISTEDGRFVNVERLSIKMRQSTVFILSHVGWSRSSHIFRTSLTCL